ncbi:MAG: ubiquinol-cytochrome C chaperone family protein [Roseiarcus sp.]
MILARWRARRANRILIEQIHGEIVAAARAPALYAHWAVADSLDGRFEMMALHAGLVTRRLDDLGDLGAQIAQDLVDCVFGHFEDALREMAIGDAGVVRRVKTMAAAFHGRNRAYGEALAARDAEALAAALARNVYGASEVSAAPRSRDLAAYVFAAALALEREEIDFFSGGRFFFPGALGDAR